VIKLQFDKKTLDTASQNFFRCDFKELDKSNQRWIIEGLQKIQPKKQVCDCGDHTPNESGVCDTCKMLKDMEGKV
jgi:hypothetical protein